MRHVDGLIVMLRNQDKRFLNHGHHAQTQQIHFDDPHVGTVFFIPLDHSSARHGGSFQRYHTIQLALAYHHASGVLTEMPWQILNTHAKLEKFADMQVLNIKPCMKKRLFQGIVVPFPFPLRYQARETPECLGIETHRLSHFTRCRLAAIGDHICSNGGTKLSIPLVDVLNCLFAFISGGEIKVDVRPFSTAFAQEALKKQFHANRIDRGYFQCVANGGIGCTPTPLYQDVVSLAVIHQVPNDQKIAGKA